MKTISELRNLLKSKKEIIIKEIKDNKNKYTISSFLLNNDFYKNPWNKKEMKKFIEDNNLNEFLKKTYTKNNKKWNEISCKEEAKKYTRLRDFLKYSKTAYKSAKKNNWISSYTWLTVDNINISDPEWCVYIYVFDNKYVYVGLTRNIKRRDREHYSREKDSLYKFYKENNYDFPKYKIIKDNITAIEAQKLENTVKTNYEKDKNYTVINKGKTGIGIGSLGSLYIKWTKEKCYDSAKLCKTIKEFKETYKRAYTVSHENGWFEEYTWLKRGNGGPKSGISKEKYAMYSKEGKFIKVFNGLVEIFNELNNGKRTNTISKVASGKRKTSLGYIWKYLKDVTDKNGDVIKQL